ncbi:MAG: LCP family protein [Actinobacteria bacterium]|nr:LCP family protein [Actinomycetota bacterium]
MSFPRDAYVTIPAYRDAKKRQRPAHKDKLNAAFSLGGPALLVATIEGLTKLRVDHYIEVNFAGFERTVDALGGVTLCARTTRNDPSNGPMGGSDDFMKAGTHKDVSGAVALAFVRNRHSFSNGDIARIQNQQYFLSQLLKKAISRGTLTSPPRLNAFLTSVVKSLRVDNRLSVSDMQRLAFRLRKADPAHVSFVTLPFTTVNGRALINGNRASVVLVDAPAAQRLFARLRGDAPAPAASPRPGSPPPAPPPAVGRTGDQLSCGA